MPDRGWGCPCFPDRAPGFLESFADGPLRRLRSVGDGASRGFHSIGNGLARPMNDFLCGLFGLFHWPRVLIVRPQRCQRKRRCQRQKYQNFFHVYFPPRYRSEDRGWLDVLTTLWKFNDSSTFT